MNNLLQEIVRRNRELLAERRRKLPLSELERRIADAPEPKDFYGALRGPGSGVIAELKKASPSRGVIRPELPVAELARELEAAGAAALSVLTEPCYFLGSPEALQQAVAAVSLPVLRKDFLFDSYQVYEARAWGASAVLLIAALLPDAALRELLAVARSLKLAVLAEAHTAEELDRLLALDFPAIGVNARNLATFATDLAGVEALLRRIPGARIRVAESAITTPAELRRLRAAGADGFLIGEALMRAEHPGIRLRELLGDGN